MRTAFIEQLFAEAIQPNVWLLTADLGYSVIEPFRDTYPERFVNVGIAEQNMTGVAAGLAMSGQTVFTYSIANFPTMRCLEQIRNDVCYHNLPVNIVAVGGGCAYGALGYTHHGIEDLAIMRTLPNMRVLAPGDASEAAAATKALCENPGPAYLRLGKSGERKIHNPTDLKFEIGKAITVCQGDDITLISTGGMLSYCIDVAEQLQTTHRIKARVVSMHTIKPIDREAIFCAADSTGGIITVEDHNVASGLGNVVADVLCTEGKGHIPFAKFGLTDNMLHVVGDQAYMMQAMGSLAQRAVDLLRKPQRRAA